MKIHFKITKGLTATILMVSLMAPGLVFAETSASSEGKRPAPKNVFCTRLTSNESSMKNQLLKNFGQLSERKQERVQTFKANRDDRKEKFVELRNIAKDARTEAQKKLSKIAKTDAQKVAVQNFQTQAKAAMDVRHTAIDAAMLAFRTALDKEAENRNTILTQAHNTYKTTVQTAVVKSKTDCTAGKDVVTVKAELTTALKSAKDALQTARQQLAQSKTAIETITKTRNEAVKKAAEEFRATMEKLRAELKSTFTVKTNFNSEDKTESETAE